MVIPVIIQYRRSENLKRKASEVLASASKVAAVNENDVAYCGSYACTLKMQDLSPLPSYLDSALEATTVTAYEIWKIQVGDAVNTDAGVYPVEVECTLPTWSKQFN